MSVRVFWRSTARCSLCSSCLLFRRTGAYYSQAVAGRIQYPEAPISAGTSARTLTGTRDNSHRAVADARNPSDPTRLDRYLASIKATDLEPTLDDIEQCRPEGFSRPDSSSYAAEYTNLQETLCRSFSKDQLRHFTELYSLDPIWSRSSRRKTEYAESIIEKAWGWPSLKEIERKRRDTTEMVVKSFTVTPGQLFLIMGRDGVDLLQLSTQYNVHISLTSNPLALRVEGLRGSLKALTEHINSLKKSIIDEIFELPSGRPVRPDLLQRISRLAGAYVENHGHRGKVRICANHFSNITAAKRLARRASLEVGTQAHVVCFDPPNKIKDSPIKISQSRRYSIYPFVTPSSFPWTMHSGGAFRLRRVADWLDIDSYEDITSTGGLADNQNHLLNLDQSEAELSRLVCPPQSTTYSRRIITALLGHILISSSDNSQRTTIHPPLRGVFSLPDILTWVGTCGAPLTFVPSVPPAMMISDATKQRALHRLIYRTLPQIAGQVPQHILKFEMELPTPIAPVRGREKAPEKAILFSGESNTGPVLSQQSHTQSDGSSDTLTAKRGLSCQVGRETYINLMFPDRPMDVQLSTFEWDDITLMQQPQVLREYAEKFRYFLTNITHLSQPDPPSTLTCAGGTYYLHDSLYLTQSDNPNLLSAISSDRNTNNLVEVCSENIADLQSSRNMSLCQVKFDGATEGPTWRRFLSACDQLSVISLQSRSEDKARTPHQEK